MSRPESKSEPLEVSRLDPIFEGIEPVEGAEATRTVIGEIDERRWARIKRVAGMVLNQETHHHEYQVDLAFPHDIHEEITIVCSTVWAVTPQAALESETVAENKSSEQFAIYHPLHPPNQMAITRPEDIFKWYDHNAKKDTPKVTPEPSPNIYTAEGMTELTNTAKFREAETNGEA